MKGTTFPWSPSWKALVPQKTFFGWLLVMPTMAISRTLWTDPGLSLSLTTLFCLSFPNSDTGYAFSPWFPIVVTVML